MSGAVILQGDVLDRLRIVHHTPDEKKRIDAEVDRFIREEKAHCRLLER